MSRLFDIYRSGYVQRYHTNPQMAWAAQTNGHHQWGVTVLLLELFPDRVTVPLLWEALYHDAGEIGAADVSSPAKRRYPDLAKAVTEAEENERFNMGIAPACLEPMEAILLKFCDVLESYLFARILTPWVLEGDGWPEQRSWLLGQAEVLMVEDQVAEMLA
jgi:5'-deoxynucleotidase YfbR-like HD superfamily hydrolase